MPSCRFGAALGRSPAKHDGAQSLGPIALFALVSKVATARTGQLVQQQVARLRPILSIPRVEVGIDEITGVVALPQLVFFSREPLTIVRAFVASPGYRFVVDQCCVRRPDSSKSARAGPQTVVHIVVSNRKTELIEIAHGFEARASDEHAGSSHRRQGLAYAEPSERTGMILGFAFKPVARQTA
jgi:hypothetical protein